MRKPKTEYLLATLLAQTSLLKDIEPIKMLLTEAQFQAYCELQKNKCYTEQVVMLAGISANVKIIHAAILCANYYLNRHIEGFSAIDFVHIVYLRTTLESVLQAEFSFEGNVYSVYSDRFFERDFHILQ